MLEATRGFTYSFHFKDREAKVQKWQRQDLDSGLLTSNPMSILLTSTPMTGKKMCCFWPKGLKYHLLLVIITLGQCLTVFGGFSHIRCHLSLQVSRAGVILEKLKDLSKVTQPVQVQYIASSRDSIRIKFSLNSSLEVLEVNSTILALVLLWSQNAKSIF